MTQLRVEQLKLPSVDFNGVSSLPSIHENLRLTFMQDVFELSDDDGLFINYGMVEYAYPYKTQDNYTRKLQDKQQPCIVLENDYLKAIFMPQFGGKLYSLFDKKAGKELLYVNGVVRPCQLAVRNAWLSGGVEWNCGYVGHNAFTCDWMHTARTKLEDGTPVLRFYQYERIRSIVYQMDFFLPEDSKLLFVRTKIVNPQYKVVPMYWWSNVAVPDVQGNRVIVPVTNTYTVKDSHPVKIAVPEYNGKDITYPLNSVIAIDYFWNVPENERKYICQVDRSGYGLVQTSTRRLQGRKLFVWGDSAGGERWKNFLTADHESGSYNEIQAGLAKTQYECLPMPPKTVWEWVEAYGAIRLDPEKAHGSWDGAKAEAAQCLNRMLSEEALEQLLKATRKMANMPAEEMLYRADGWGALEQKRRAVCKENPMCEYLDFGQLTDEQMPWLSVLEKGTVGAHDPALPPVSYMYQAEWNQILQKAVAEKDRNNWFAWLQLGLHAFMEKNYEKAEQQLLKSVELQPSAWAMYGLSVLHRDMQCHEKEVCYMLQAWQLRQDDASLAKQTLRCLCENGRFGELKQIYEALNESLQMLPRCKVYYAFALLHSGDIAGAEGILYEDGGLLIPDMRECDTITLDLWVAIEKKKADLEGRIFDEANMNPPKFVDFRMFANQDWLNGGEIIRE